MGAHRWRTDVALRLIGMALAAVGAWCAHDLFGAGTGAPCGEPALCVLAVLAFVGCSVGAALLMLGSHLLDDVAIPRRAGGGVSAADLSTHWLSQSGRR